MLVPVTAKRAGMKIPSFGLKEATVGLQSNARECTEKHQEDRGWELGKNISRQHMQAKR